MLRVATFNLYNLGSDVASPRLKRLAEIISNELQGPDILGIQEIKAVTPVDIQGQVPATQAFQLLIEAIANTGGPDYAFREIPPMANRDGGYPGFNIRVGLLFNPQRVEFQDRGTAGPYHPAGIRLINGQPALTLNPGRIDPLHPAFEGDSNHHWKPSRKALASEFLYHNQRIFLIVCHLKSMRAATRREEEYAKKQRHAQAGIIHRFAATLLACDPCAKVVILGDMNDVRGSKTLKILKGELLINLMDNIPRPFCYTCRHGGRPLTLDYILISPSLQTRAHVHIPHVNSDQPEPLQVSDHDPVLATLDI
jgi:predicted extracellular nuclease